MVAASACRELVRWMGTRGLTARCALGVVGVNPSSLRFQPRPDRSATLRTHIVARAQRHRCFVVEMIHRKINQPG